MKSLCIMLLAFVLSSATSLAEESSSKKAKTSSISKPMVSEAEAKRAASLFADGRKLFFQGSYLKAAETIKQAVKTDSSKTSYRLLLAKAYRNGSQTKNAVDVLTEIIKQNPDHVEAGLQLAELISAKKEPDRVIAVLQPLLKFKHDYPLYRLLAEAYYEKEDFKASRKHYEQAIKLNPRNANDHYQLGNIYLVQKRFAKAAQAYESAGRLGFESAVFHFKLASVYFNLRNYQGKVKTAEVVGGKIGEIKNYMFLINPVPGRKNTFYVAGRKSSIYQVAKAQQMGIDIFDIRFLEANIWLSARRFAKADPIYRLLQDKFKKEDAGLFWYYWAQTALGLDQFENYLERLNKAIEAQPDIYKSTLTDAMVTVANRYHQRGDTKRYIEYLKRALASSPLSATLHLTLGDAQWQADNSKKAIEQYRLVLELAPEHGQRVRLLNRIRGQESLGGN